MNRAAAFALVLLLAGCGDSKDEGSGSTGRGGGPGLDPFDDGVLATYEITMDPSDWSAMVADLQDNTWRRATLLWRGETWADVAIHPAGQSSRKPGLANANKPSLWLSFDQFVPGREFHDYERIKLDGLLDDPAMLRERLAYPLYAARGVPAPKVAHCRVVVNGVYRGLYLVEERVNKEFLTKRFGSPANQLYRWSESEPDLVYEPGYGAAAYAAFPPSFAMWEARIESLPDGAAEVRELVRLINEDPVGASALFDTDAFLQWMAVEVATGETDGYVGSSFLEPGVGDPDDFYTGNIFMSRIAGTGTFRFIVWDRDQAFWRLAPVTFGFDRRIMTRRLLLDIPGNLDRFKLYLRQVIDGPAHPDVLEARLDFLRDQIRQAAFEDPFKSEPSNADLEDEWRDLREFFRERRDGILPQL